MLLMPVFAQEEIEASYNFPEWLNTVKNYWQEGIISDQEFDAALDYLITQKIIHILENHESIINDKIKSQVAKEVTKQEAIEKAEEDRINQENKIKYAEMENKREQQRIKQEAQYQASITLTLQIDKTSYRGGEILTITGYAPDYQRDGGVTIQIISPSGSVVGLSQLIPDSNSFEYTTSFSLSSESIKEEGVYKVRAQQGSQKVETTFTLTDISEYVKAPKPTPVAEPEPTP